MKICLRTSSRLTKRPDFFIVHQKRKNYTTRMYSEERNGEGNCALYEESSLRDREGCVEFPRTTLLERKKVIAEIVKWMLRQLLRSVKITRYLEGQLSAAILNLPQIRFVQPGHFYSPLPDLTEVEAEQERIYRLPQAINGIDLQPENQRDLLAQLLAYYPSFRWTEEPLRGHRYWLRNDYFGYGDAVILFSMMQCFAPGKIIEIGSGFSSALMLDTNDFFGDGGTRFSFIEPNPQRLSGLLTRKDRETVKIFEEKVQKVPLNFFDQLENNDILFIDSSHVSKIGSDVNHIVFEVLPRLKEGVLVHFHDIFYPFEYPLDWVREGRSWNEAYLIRAFLQYNEVYEIIMFNNYVGQRFRDYILDHAPLMSKNSGSSLWLRKKTNC